MCLNTNFEFWFKIIGNFESVIIKEFDSIPMHKLNPIEIAAKDWDKQRYNLKIKDLTTAFKTDYITI